MSKFRSQLDSLVARKAQARAPASPHRQTITPPISPDLVAHSHALAQNSAIAGQNQNELAQIKSTLQTLTSSLAQLAKNQAAPPAVQPNPQFEQEKLAEKLRNNMREQVSHEIGKIRKELDGLQINSRQLKEKANNEATERALIADVQRISQGIKELQSRHSSSKDQFGELAGGINNIRQEIRSIAQRSEVSIDPAQITNSIQANYDEIAKRLDGLGEAQTGERIDALNDKIDTLRSSLNNLRPEAPVGNDSLQNIESQLQQLSSKISSMPAQSDGISSATEEFLPGYFENLDRRLDEITRAVVAAAPQESAPVDNSAFDRIEARMGSLAKSLDELNSSAASTSNSANFPDLEKLPKQIHATISRLESSISQMGTTLGGSSRFVQEALGGQLNSLSEKIDGLSGNAIANVPELNTAELEQKIDALAVALNQVSQTGVGATQNLQRQIADLAKRIDHIIKAGTTAPAENPQFKTLENQINAISSQLNSLGSAPDTSELEARLGGIEQQVISSREMAVETANRAAQQALSQIKSADFGEAHVNAISSLAEDLQKLSSSSSELKGLSLETFDAVRESLSMILDRVNAIELKIANENNNDQLSAQLPDNDTMVDVAREYATGLSQNHSASPLVATNAELPSEWVAELDGAGHHQLEVEDNQAFDEHQFLDDHHSEMVDTALSAHEPAKPFNIPDENQDLEQTAPPSLDIQEIPQVPQSELSDVDDMPLEPGSGAPNLDGPDMDALIRKADERQKNIPVEDSHNPTDFIAAARRAAQAAASEAQFSDDHAINDVENPKLGGIKEMLSQRRKPIIIAASLVLLAALAVPIASSYLGGQAEIATENLEPSEISIVEGSSEGDNESNDQTTSRLSKIASSGDSTGTDVTSDEITATNPAVRTVKPASSTTMMPKPITPETDGDTSMTIGELAAKSELNSEAKNPNGTMASGALLPGMAMPADAMENKPGSPLTMAPMPPQEVGPQALRQAAASGEPTAQFEVARRYTAGLNGKPDLASASIWYERAANSDYAPAQYRIGNFYEKGHGVTSDVNMAADWYNKAASNGNALAMHNLAVINAMGVLEGGANMGEAVKWFKKAAEHGVKDSQVNLGILYAKAMGVDEDLSQAYKWFAIAAKAGDRDALQKRDTVAKAMRPEQLERARGELELWRPAKLIPEANKAPVKPEWFADSQTTASLDSETIVRTAQSMLNELGFEAGPADGKMGSKTRNAIKAFQKRAGVEITGKASEELIEILKKAS